MSLRFTAALVLSIVCLIAPACATDTAETPDMNVVIANALSKSAEEGNATANDLQKLAEAGNAAAQYRLGLLYHDGQGVPQSYEGAKHWFAKAAEQGHAGAQVNLGTIYLVGHGFYQSDPLALFWFRKAAEQKDALACAKLGLMYGRGQGVSRDVIQAHMWYDLAVANRALGAVEARDALAKQMTPAMIAEAEKLAREWKPKDKGASNGSNARP
jgi:TPR repeat protein